VARRPAAAPANAMTGAFLARAATAVPSSYNEADGSFEVIWTTGAAVRRFDWAEGEFDELLSTDPAAVRLERMNAGAPVLSAHNMHTLEGVIGSIVPGSARMVNGQGTARIRLADTPDAADIVAKVMAGHIRNVSVGYMVHKYEPVEAAETERRTLLAVDWEPVEVSLVPIGADAATQIRGIAAAQPAGINGRAVSASYVRQRAAAAGLSDRVTADLLERHATTPFDNESLIAMIGTQWAARDQGAPQNGRISILQDETETTRNRVEAALYARMAKTAPPPAAQELMGGGLVGMCRALLEARGERVRHLSDSQVIERSLHTTGDFPQLLTAAGNRYLMETFALAESAIKRVARMRTAPDFRTLRAIKLEGAPLLTKVEEGGEVQRGTMTEGAESYGLATFAKIFGISRQAIINDDLGAFADPLRLMARGAAETEAQELANLLLANSGNGVTMADGQPLYHSTHGNLAASGAALSVTSLSAARAAMRDQKDLDKVSPLNVVPRTILVGSALETLAETLVATLSPVAPGDVNPFAGKLEVAVDPRLTGNAWRLFADPAMWPVIEYAYLDGGVGPQLSSREGWDVLGMEFKVVLDFGCGIVDHRGTFRNPGA
jgi:HK97 family phage prohead protease